MLSLVAEKSGTIVGHIAVSATTIGNQRDWALIGPVSVLPEAQLQGVGSALIRAALEHLRIADMAGTALVGNPAYYRRFGFRAWPELTVRGVADRVVQALPFSNVVPFGELAHHEAFGLSLQPNSPNPFQIALLDRELP